MNKIYMPDNACIKWLYTPKNKLHNSLLFLCILNYKYLWNLDKWSDQAQIFREWFLDNGLWMFYPEVDATFK